MRPHAPPAPSAGCRSACSLVAVGQHSWDLFCSPSCLSVRRDWGIENFISPTLLRNMRGKDIKKAISYHMKRNQILLDPRQKVVCVAWVGGASWNTGSISQGQRGHVFPVRVSSLCDCLLCFCFFFFPLIFSFCNLCSICTLISPYSVL